MLELWANRGFATAKFPFPGEVVDLWSGSKKDKDEACRIYQAWLTKFASASLANYVQAVVDHILPVMQSEEALYRITRERIEDAAKDGIIGLEIRFAPQLHTWEGLSLDRVMKAVIAAVKEAPIAVDLTICALRHENAEMGRKLGDLCVKYHRYVGCMDLAADEAAFPGVLDWWLNEAVRARAIRRMRRLRPLVLKCHLGETNPVTDSDNAKLANPEKFVLPSVLDGLGIASDHPSLAGEIRIEGHGIRDNDSDRVREVCPTSNVVTGQVASLAQHNIDEMFRAGKSVTVNTDGLTLTGLTGLTQEYANLQRVFGWTKADFYRANLTALNASSFSTRKKAALKRQLKSCYA